MHNSYPRLEGAAGGFEACRGIWMKFHAGPVR